MTRSDEDAIVWLIFIAVIAVVLFLRRRPRLSTTAHGTALWAYHSLLKKWGFLGKYGLLLGRTAKGHLIRIPRYCHLLIIGGTGSGKGVGFYIPNLLTYPGTVISHDPKLELFALTAVKRQQKMGHRIILLAPSISEAHKLNCFDLIPPDEMVYDNAAALAEAMVPQDSHLRDSYWRDSAAQILRGVLTYALLKLPHDERNLNSVQDLISDHDALYRVGVRLKAIGGIAQRMGGRIHGLFTTVTDEGRITRPIPTREGFSVINTLARSTDWLNSNLIAASVAESTFDPKIILEPGTTTYIHIPIDKQKAWQGWLRCVIATITRLALTTERSNEVLCLFDEAILLNGLQEIEQALTLGRSSKLRLCLGYQGDSLVVSAFKDKPGLLYENCATKIYLSPDNLETAERISKMLGNYTEPLESYGESYSYSSGRQPNSDQRNRSLTVNTATHPRPLFYADEILRAGSELVYCFPGHGFPAPILCRRLSHYADPLFTRQPFKWWWWNPKWAAVSLFVALVIALLVRAKHNGPWEPSQPQPKQTKTPKNPQPKPQPKKGDKWKKSR
jgi:type IV secretion system protein VirD4